MNPHAKMVAFQTQLAALHALFHNTLDSIPETFEKSSNEIDRVSLGYCHHFSHQWSRQRAGDIATLQEMFIVILEEQPALEN